MDIAVLFVVYIHTHTVASRAHTHTDTHTYSHARTCTHIAGTFLDLGASYQFQYISSKVSPVKRVLPQTPGQALDRNPPSKPPRQQISTTKVESSSERVSEMSGSHSCGGRVELEKSAIDEGLRTRLKRIAKEVASRASGYQDRKPPPVRNYP